MRKDNRGGMENSNMTEELKLKMIENRLETELLGLSMLAEKYQKESKVAEKVLEVIKPLVKKIKNDN